MHNIKRAVSLYSYQDEYARKRMTLEDIFRELSSLGVAGVEILSDQMIHGAPYPTPETVRMWRGLLEKYGIAAVCNDIFINSTLYHNRRLTVPEQVKLLEAEIRNAHALGFSLIRLVSNTDAALLEPVLPLAEKLGVSMALEIHAGMSFDTPLSSRFIQEMRRLDSPYLGLVVDMGIFSRRHPRVSRDYFMQFGLNPALADFIDDVFEKRHTDLWHFQKQGAAVDDFADSYPDEMKALILSPVDREYAIFATGYENSPTDILDAYMPYVRHIHGKCYEMTEECEEYSIAYDEVIPYLTRQGYEGYIATEYEGNRFVRLDETVDGVGNVRKHQTMLKRYLGH